MYSTLRLHCCTADIMVSGCFTSNGDAYLWGANTNSQIGKGNVLHLIHTDLVCDTYPLWLQLHVPLFCVVLCKSQLLKQPICT